MKTQGELMQIRLQDLRNEARGIFENTYRILVAFAMFELLFSAAAFSQEATQTAPLAYKLQFENEWVRVIRAHYEPREKIPAHAHTKWPCAYVYLNDGGPIIFRHKGWEHPELTRPATQSGSFRLSPTTAVNEVHEVENPNDTPSDFLRVEFKTEPVGRNSLSGRFYREEYPAGGNSRTVQFENEQIRITRLICAPHRSLDVKTSSSEPALLVSLSAVQLRSERATKQTKLEPGQTIWVAQKRQERFENIDDAPIEFLQFDFRTVPVKPQERPKKSGE
jgi:hypothetical protein